MDSLVAAAHPYLSQYGYKALFAVLFTESFGFLLPGETFLIGATLLAMKGQFDIIVVAGWAIMAVVLGSNVGYLIGRRGGYHWAAHHGSRLGITPARLEAAQRFFDRYGAGAMIVARFFPVLRQLSSIIAGSMQMPWKKFVVYNTLGGVSWVATWTAGVYFLGSQIEMWLMQVHVAGWWLVGPLIAVMAWLIYHSMVKGTRS
jgi:membrane protein DedA with SNARE-associated domain